ncbi:MAG: hypothetical protein AAGI90_05315 [Chlamydiota bacterium]
MNVFNTFVALDEQTLAFYILKKTALLIYKIGSTSGLQNRVYKNLVTKSSLSRVEHTPQKAIKNLSPFFSGKLLLRRKDSKRNKKGNRTRK